uniref:Uncharacterized protein n=1 Tax=Arundo donax TaxID=35708 RepID=A0A0A9AWU6_ARUDO
MGSQNCSSQD